MGVMNEGDHGTMFGLIFAAMFYVVLFLCCIRLDLGSFFAWLGHGCYRSYYRSGLFGYYSKYRYTYVAVDKVSICFSTNNVTLVSVVWHEQYTPEYKGVIHRYKSNFLITKELNRNYTAEKVISRLPFGQDGFLEVTYYPTYRVYLLPSSDQIKNSELCS